MVAASIFFMRSKGRSSMVSAIVFQVPSGTWRLLAGTARKSNASLIVLRTSGPCCCYRTMNTTRTLPSLLHTYLLVSHNQTKELLVLITKSREHDGFIVAAVSKKCRIIFVDKMVSKPTCIMIHMLQLAIQILL